MKSSNSECEISRGAKLDTKTEYEENVEPSMIIDKLAAERGIERGENVKFENVVVWMRSCCVPVISAALIPFETELIKRLDEITADACPAKCTELLRDVPSKREKVELMIWRRPGEEEENRISITLSPKFSSKIHPSIKTDRASEK